MKMKYRKIRNIPLDVCTAEQKIAYKIAFSLHISFQDDFDRVNAVCPGNAQNDCFKLVNEGLKRYRLGCKYRHGRYNEDAIQAALNAGLYGYMCKPFIATSFEQVGKAFPALYL